MQPTVLPRRPPSACTFDLEDWEKLAHQWFPIALAREVGEGPATLTLLDTALVLYRVGDRIVLADDVCPHRGVPLSLGRHDGSGISCAYHGLHFGQDGRCTRIPAQPHLPIPSSLHLKTYPAVERYGLIWTSLRATQPDIPSMPHWDDSGFQQIVCPTIDIFAFAGRQIEGFLDVAHFGFVHADTFGDPNNTSVPRYVPKPTEKGFEVEYRSTLSNYPIGRADRGPPDFEWLRHFRVHLPFTATLTVHFPDDGRLAIMNAASPVSARKTRLFVPIARDFDTQRPIEEVYEFNRRVFEEDKLIVESQKPESLPLDPTLEAHIAADRSSIAYRRGLRDMAFGRFFVS